MLFVSSVEYLEMAIMIFSDKNVFKCHKYRWKRRIKICRTKDDLLSFENGPIIEIQSLIFEKKSYFTFLK